MTIPTVAPIGRPVCDLRSDGNRSSTRSRRLWSDVAAGVVRLLLCLAALCGAPCAVRADEAATEIADVEIGFHGATKVGRWTPIAFRINGPPRTAIEPTVIAPDPDGSETTWRLPECTLDESGTCQVNGLFKIGRLEGLIRVRAGNALVTVPARANAGPDDAGCTPRSQDVPFIAILGHAPGFPPAYADPDAGDQLPPAVICEIPAADRLPRTHTALDVLDAVVLAQQFDLDADRSTALADWVRRGGHLVIVLNADPKRWSESPLSHWVPLNILRTDTFSELASLVDRVPGATPLNVADGVRGLRIESPEGQVLASTLFGPLATRTPYGLGRITVLAVDWSDERIENWQGLPGLCRYLADVDLPTRETTTTQSQLRPTGVSELATQLASQLDHFGAVARPSYWTIIGFAAAFLALVGPLDYLLVHRVLKQPRLTWFTFPAWIMFAATAATLGADRLNSSERQVNQFDLVDVDGTSGLRRVQSWMTFYLPEARRLRVESSAAGWLAGSAPQPMRVTWSGMPESGFGGMYRAGGLNFANPPYTVDVNAAAIANVPIGQWASKALVSEWSGPSADSGEPLVTSELVDDGIGRLQGTFTHHLPDAITDWCVAYGGGAYFPPEVGRVDQTPSIPPGQPWNVADRVSHRQLEPYLQGRTHRYIEKKSSSGDNTTISTTIYDPLGLDPFPLARMLTFYEAANGLGYTGLKDHSLQRYDLSRILPLKRAVLFGRMASPAAEFVVDGSSVHPQERWTFVRLILPVKPGKALSPREAGILEIR